MRNIKLTVQYDGTDYHGWQVQSHHDTVQGRILTALTTMLKHPVACTGASRTDAGVHAIGQIANVRIPSEKVITRTAFYHGLNSLTPEDIIIADVQEVESEFHARFDSRAKTYCYQILNAPQSSVYHRRFSWHIRQPLDIDAMREGARCLRGEQDFASFQASSCSAETSIRTVHAVHIFRERHLIRCVIKANAYLHKMVRNIIGTLVGVGTGKIAAKSVREILDAKDRRQAGVTAPARGLFLVTVHY